ncbi:MAG: endonuclease VII domain-containing protein [Candidatus Saccharimonadales bacterium]
MKNCPKCKLDKPLTSQFWPKNRTTKSGWGTYCKVCHNKNCADSLARNGGARNYHLRRRYGVTAKQVKDTIKDQGGLCPICGELLDLDAEKRTVHQDHDHRTNKPRGVLCSSCNQGLGNFKDSIDRLEAAVKYLVYWKGGE